MGIETSPPDVEESTEPPLCSTHEGHPGSAIDHSQGDSKHLVESEKVSTDLDGRELHQCVSCHQAPSEATLLSWEEQCKYAHTISATDLSALLGVDLQYVLLLNLVSFCSTLFDISFLEMVSLVPKRHLVFAEMALTRLRVQRGYPCGKYC